MSLRPRPIDSIIQVVTPENIAFEYRIAGPFRRLGALLLDYAIMAVIYTILAVLVTVALGWLSLGLSMGVILVASFIIMWFYGGLFETFCNGQTPGKMICSLRVLTDQGQPINGLQAVMRNVLRDVDNLLGVVGLIVMTMNRRYQRLGDLACGTIVVVEDRQWLTGVAKLDDPRAIQLAAYLPPNFVVPRSMAKALATYVERRRFFSILRRREVAKYLAEPLLERFGLPADTSYDLLLCALYYRTFIADRSQDERLLAEAQAAFAQANPFAAYMNTGQPYQTSPYPNQYAPYPYGPPQPPFQPAAPPPLPQEQMAGAGTFGQGS